jgi:hypothetical protein
LVLTDAPSFPRSPLTHARFCRRHRGSYGPAIRAGEAEFPWPRTPIENLYRIGDSSFPGIGVPAAAASGTAVSCRAPRASQCPHMTVSPDASWPFFHRRFRFNRGN